MATVDASNSCIPPSYPLDACVPPLPLATRGEPLVLHGKPGRINADRHLLLYTSGRLVIVRDLQPENHKKQAFVYRGHLVPVTVAKFSPSGAYIASADTRGNLRVWSYDSDEHLCQLNAPVLAGPIRDLEWDFESKRIVVVGEVPSGECARVIQWDTGVSCGTLGQYSRGRAASCAMKPNRPMRIVTGGKDDATLYFHSGPPFQRIILDSTNMAEHAHDAGKAINCVRYNPDGTRIASVASDKAVCLYDGKTLELLCKLEKVHEANIYACDWSSCGGYLLTCSADGTVKVLKIADDSSELSIVHTYDNLLSTYSNNNKVPLGGMQMGCAFVKDDVPVTVGLNGQITMLPKPSCMGGGNDDVVAQTLTGHTAPIAGFAMDSSSSLMYTGDTDGVLVKWDVATCRAISRFESPQPDDTMLYKIHTGAVSGMTVVGDTVLSVGWDDVLRVSNLNGQVQSERSLSLEAQPNAIVTGTKLVVVSTVGGLLLVKDGAIASSLIPLEYAALSLCVSSDDTTLYVGGDDCKIHIYRVSSSCSGLEQVHVVEGGHLKPIHALALSPDESKLASADVRDVCVFSTTNYTPILSKSRWCFHTQRITCLSWYNEELLASGGADDSIYLWHLGKKMKRIHYAFAHRGGVTGLHFLSYDKEETIKLVSVGVDACVNQWDVTQNVAEKFG